MVKLSVYLIAGICMTSSGAVLAASNPAVNAASAQVASENGQPLPPGLGDTGPAQGSAYYGPAKSTGQPQDVTSKNAGSKGMGAKGKGKGGKAKDSSTGTSADVIPAEPEEEMPVADREDMGTQRAIPETLLQVTMSSTDINRIVCPAGSKDIDVVTSTEKGVKVDFHGENAFVKFGFATQDGQVVYPKKPVEFHVVCGTNIYTLIARPKKIPAQTIKLGSSDLERIEKNIKAYNGMPFERKVSSIVQSIFKDSPASSWTIREDNTQKDIFKEITVWLKRIYIIDGEGLQVKEYIVSPRGGVGIVELQEKDFMKPMLADNPVAVACRKLRVAPGEKTRVLVVESKGGRDGIAQ